MIVVAPMIVDVTSDIICPWCFIGKRRLERAAAILNQPIDISWHPFQLNPRLPSEGISRREYRIAKFGSWEYSQQLDARVAEAGRQSGIEFRFDLMQRTPNSFRGHRLLAAARKHGPAVQNSVAERLFTGYFCEGEDVGDPAMLTSIARQFQVYFDLDDPGLDAEVINEEESARDDGVQGVPLIRCEGKLISEGAAPAETLAAALKAIIQNREG